MTFLDPHHAVSSDDAQAFAAIVHDLEEEMDQIVQEYKDLEQDVTQYKDKLRVTQTLKNIHSIEE